MKKRNLISAIIAITLLTACGNSTSADVKPVSTTIESETNLEKATETQEESISETETTISFEEVIVVDNDNCSIKITDIEPDNMWGYALKAVMENKSSDKTYMFSVTDAFINGVKCNPGFATEITAGKKANKDINFLDSTLQKNGITEYTDIEIAFKVYDSNDWMAEPVAETKVHIYPYGEDKATTFIREPQEADTIIIDNDAVTAIVTGYENDDIWGYTANLFLINKTDTEVMFSVDNVSVNGYMADPFYASSLSAGKCAFSSISWSDSIFEENNITKVEEIELTFKAYDASNFGSDYFANETIILNP